MTYADQIFKENCREIINHGCWDKDGEGRPRWEDGSPAYTIKRFGIINRYDLSAEFPILTLRKINFSAALDEIFWIWQPAVTLWQSPVLGMPTRATRSDKAVRMPSSI